MQKYRIVLVGSIIGRNKDTGGWSLGGEDSFSNIKFSVAAIYYS